MIVLTPPHGLIIFNCPEVVASTGCGPMNRRTRRNAPTLTTLMPQLRTQAAHRSCPSGCAAEAWATERDALELCCCLRSCAADGGADHHLQGLEQLERRALVARATGPAQAVNIVADEHCWRWLLHGALQLCGAAPQALPCRLTARAVSTRLRQSGSAVRT